MLSVLLSLRVFLEISQTNMDDRIFLIIGCVLIVYILAALFFTYRYRFGWETHELRDRPSDSIASVRLETAIERERIKAAEKIALAEAKSQKKVAKAAVKAQKKLPKRNQLDNNKT